MSGVWRDPPEESIDLYPGLTVCDNRVTGSITLGRSRLPVWAFSAWLPRTGWAEVAESWDELYGWTPEKMGGFLTDLMELRGEFGRLLLVLADAERCDRGRPFSRRGWWETKRHRRRVVDQLRRCLAVLDSGEQIEERPSS